MNYIITISIILHRNLYNCARYTAQYMYKISFDCVKARLGSINAG